MSDHGTLAQTGAGALVIGTTIITPLPNSKPRLRDPFERLQARHGSVLVVVDQPASIGALPLAAARDADCRVAYLPGLTMRRIADLHPGESKTDARDAAIIADAARTMPPRRHSEASTLRIHGGRPRCVLRSVHGAPQLGARHQMARIITVRTGEAGDGWLCPMSSYPHDR